MSTNQISKRGIIISGTIFVVLFIINSLLLVTFWPDKMPEENRKFPSLYIFDTTSCYLKLTDANYFNTQSVIEEAEDPNVDLALDVSINIEEIDSNQASNGTIAADSKDKPYAIHLNNLLFILVILGGFLGNLIHTASSFTTFVGLRRFKRSWLMWYYVKPFIASALALVVYIIYRGGFTSMQYDGADINPYGIVSLAVLSGLFTNTITDKLEKIIDVIFPGVKQTKDGIAATALYEMTPKEIIKGKTETIVFSGKGITTLKNPFILINNTIEKLIAANDTLTFEYTHKNELPPTEVDVILMDNDKVIETFKLTIKTE